MKKDIIEVNNSPLTPKAINFFLLFFREVKNCKKANNKDSHRTKFPKEADIS